MGSCHLEVGLTPEPSCLRKGEYRLSGALHFLLWMAVDELQMATSTINITVLFFARAREVTGTAEEKFQMHAGDDCPVANACCISRANFRHIPLYGATKTS